MGPSLLKAESNSKVSSEAPSTAATCLFHNVVFNRVGVLAFGTIANSVVGALTGLLGSLIWQHNRNVLQGIMIIGSLSGGTGGLLHAFVVHASKNLEGNTLNGENDFGRLCARVFSEAPCWSMIGASIGFWTARNFNSDISFPVVIFTALAGTLCFAIYAIVMCRVTGSYLHLLILQNQVLVLAERLNICWTDSENHSSQSQIKPYYPLMPEFESSPTKKKQVSIDIKEED